MPTDTFFNLPEEKRQRVIDAALEEFATHTYYRGSLSRIVDRAGIAKGSMYQYFDDKMDLCVYLLGMVGAAKVKAITTAVEALGPGADVFDILRAYVEAGVEWGRSDPRLVAAGTNLLKENDPELWGRVASLSPSRGDLLGGWLGKAAERGQIDSRIDPEVARRVVVTLFESVGHLAIMGFPEDDVCEYAGQILHILEHGLRPSQGRDGG